MSYKDEIKKMQWSYSRLSSFEECKYSFYLKYIVDDDELYPSENNFWAEVGSFVHEILAMIFENKLTPDEASHYYAEHFDEHIEHKTKENIMQNTYEKCADYFATVDFSWLNDYEILGVEKKVKFKIGKYKFLGFIDLLLRDKRDGKIVIVDNKSSEYPFKKDGTVKANSKKSFESYKKQMYLYSYAVHELYDEYPKEITWNHFKDGGKLATVPFMQDEYDQAVDWMLNTIKTIEDEEDYSASSGTFYCYNLCNYRYCCDGYDNDEEG